MKKTAAENEVAALMAEIKKGNTAKKTVDKKNTFVISGQTENETIVDDSESNSASDSSTESQPIIEINTPLLEKKDDKISLPSNKKRKNAGKLSLQYEQRGKEINRLNQKVRAQKKVINQLTDNCKSNYQTIDNLTNENQKLKNENEQLQYKLEQMPNNIEYLTNELNELNVQLFETEQKLKKYEKDKTMSIACFIEESQKIVHSIAFSIKEFFRK